MCNVYYSTINVREVTPDVKILSYTGDGQIDFFSPNFREPHVKTNDRLRRRRREINGENRRSPRTKEETEEETHL